MVGRPLIPKLSNLPSRRQTRRHHQIEKIFVVSFFTRGPHTYLQSVSVAEVLLILNIRVQYIIRIRKL